MIDYQCSILSDPFQQVQCLRLQDSANLQAEVVSSVYALLTMFCALVVVYIIWCMVFRPSFSFFNFSRSRNVLR